MTTPARRGRGGRPRRGLREARLDLGCTHAQRELWRRGAEAALERDAGLDREADWARAVLDREARYQLTLEDPVVHDTAWPIVETLLRQGLTREAIAHGLRAAAEAVETSDDA